MTLHYQVPGGPSEALFQQSKYASEHDESGQNISNCLIEDHTSETWPHKCMRYFKPSTRQYTHSGYHTAAQAPAASAVPVRNTMLKTITKSVENIRGHLSPRSRPSSPSFSPTEKSFLSNNSIFQGDEITSPMSFAAGTTVFNSQELNSSFKQHMPIFVDKINTQLSSAPRYDIYGDQSALPSTTTSSSYETDLWTPISAHAPSLVSPLSHTMVSPSSETSGFRMSHSNGPDLFGTSTTPCDAHPHPYSPLSYLSNTHDIEEHFNEFSFLQGISMQQGGVNREATMSALIFDNDIDVDYIDVLKDPPDEIDNSWAIPQPLFSTRTMFCDGLEVVPADGLEVVPDDGLEVVTADGATESDHADPGRISLTSYSDISMPESGVASDGNISPISSPSPTPTAADQLSSSQPPPKCRVCGWSPDANAGHRSFAKLRAAVEKHFKRNHQGQDHPCPACPQYFRNRPDNVKPHIRRKHPELFKRLYQHKKKPSAVSMVSTQNGSSSSSTCESRDGSVVESHAGMPPTTRRSGRYSRSQRV